MNRSAPSASLVSTRCAARCPRWMKAHAVWRVAWRLNQATLRVKRALDAESQAGIIALLKHFVDIKAAVEHVSLRVNHELLNRESGLINPPFPILLDVVKLSGKASQAELPGAERLNSSKIGNPDFVVSSNAWPGSRAVQNRPARRFALLCAICALAIKPKKLCNRGGVISRTYL
jgi:hypothetical protein